MAKIFDFFHPMKHTARFVIAVIVGGAILFALLGIGAIQIWEYSNSNAFCATVCHQVHPEEPAAYADSQHARVKCVECHMGRLGTLKSMRLKASHAKHLPATIFKSYHRPVRSESLQPASDSCELCHWPMAPHSDTLREIKRYLPDENNTEQTTRFVLKVGGSDPNEGLEGGIHWHIVNSVEFIATDESKQEIPWVRLTRADGSVVEFTDPSAPAVHGNGEETEIHKMDCIDCHNRMGHPFISPEKAVDDALAKGRLSKDIPFIKKKMFELLSTDYEDQAEALEAAGKMAEEYSSRGFEVGELADELVQRVIFEKPGITWESFPDNQRHKDFPGCFRCHDGNHRSSDGEVISLNCTSCHTSPERIPGGMTSYSLSLVSSRKPPSHEKSTFVTDHRILASDKCSSCHGEIRYGSDDSSFCASSACHGNSWPRVDVDREFIHPMVLEGNHKEAACYECHQGVTNPKGDCASCHTRPRNHLSGNCDSCHSPDGWEKSAALLVAASSTLPHPVGGMESCMMCHDPGGMIKPAPANHKAYNERQCLVCHKS